MTTNTTWTTVNGVVMPGSGTQTFNRPCHPCAMPLVAPLGFDNCSVFGMPGLPVCFNNMWPIPCGCMHHSAIPGMPT